MKTKRKPERVLERMTRFLKWVFWDETGGELRGGWFVLVIVLFSALFSFLVVPKMPPAPLPHERYQAVFDDCIAAATLTAEQCHDIALAVIQ